MKNLLSSGRMDIKNYKGVESRVYEFKGHIYVLCNIDYEGEPPEEYSKNRDGGWCGLSVINVDASPIKEGIYPIQTMFFDWDEKHERMHPTDVEARDDSCGYDLEEEELVHFNEITWRKKNGTSPNFHCKVVSVRK